MAKAKKKTKKATRTKTAKRKTTRKTTSRAKTKRATARKKTTKRVAARPKKTTRKTTSRGNGKGRKANTDTFSSISEKLTYLETQALKAYECVQAVKKRGAPDWKKWVNNVSKQDWTALASAQKDRVSLEIRQLSDEILSRINCADVLENKDKILKEAKANLDTIVKNVDHSNLVDKAIDTAIHTKDGLLAFLNIPTHNEMTKLQRNLKKLERRMNSMSMR